MARPIPTLVREMAGAWRVEQRMWTGTATTPLVLPAAIGRRRLVEGGFLEEIMEKSPRARGDTFTRVACLNFNAVTQQFGYVSLDSRSAAVDGRVKPWPGTQRGRETRTSMSYRST
jgi:hypothetical protein